MILSILPILVHLIFTGTDEYCCFPLVSEKKKLRRQVVYCSTWLVSSRAVYKWNMSCLYNLNSPVGGCASLPNHFIFLSLNPSPQLWNGAEDYKISNLTSKSKFWFYVFHPSPSGGGKSKCMSSYGNLVKKQKLNFQGLSLSQYLLSIISSTSFIYNYDTIKQ